MKLAYFSPLSPEASGISDFSEELLMALKKHLTVDVFCKVTPVNQNIIDNFKLYRYDDIENDDIRKKYDFLVFQIGNNINYHGRIIELFEKYGGIMELHDFSLHNYLAEKTYAKKDYMGYYNAVKYSHGSYGAKIAREFLAGRASAPWEAHPLDLTVNKPLVERADAIIVHSDMAKQMIKGIRPDVPIISIQLHVSEQLDDVEEYKTECRKMLNIKGNPVVMGSFGFATSAKRITQILEALCAYKKQVNKNFHYFIVGKVEINGVEKLIEQLDLSKNVTITGFVDLDAFKRYMGACDFCFNLRYPTHGESSASLHRMLGMGKAVIVSDIGSFREYPDDIVLKVRYDENEIQDIYDAICNLTQSPEVLAATEKQALDYAQDHCDLNKNAGRYAAFFRHLKEYRYNDDYIDGFADKLMKLNLTDRDYLNYLANNKLNIVHL